MSGISEDGSSACEIDSSMPQWKVELIQRRKNLAKTIGATANSSNHCFNNITSQSGAAMMMNGNKLCSGSKDSTTVNGTENTTSCYGNHTNTSTTSSSSSSFGSIGSGGGTYHYNTTNMSTAVSGHSHNSNKNDFRATPLQSSQSSSPTSSATNTFEKTKNLSSSSSVNNLSSETKENEKFGNSETMEKINMSVNKNHFSSSNGRERYGVVGSTTTNNFNCNSSTIISTDGVVKCATTSINKLNNITLINNKKSKDRNSSELSVFGNQNLCSSETLLHKTGNNSATNFGGCGVAGEKPNNLKVSDLNSKEKMVAAQEIAFENFDDSSEELKYGPGIVSKLRCRYLSLALRQSTLKQRPSLNNMRRSTSLNNLLDDEDEECTGNEVAPNDENNSQSANHNRIVQLNTNGDIVDLNQKNANTTNITFENGYHPRINTTGSGAIVSKVRTPEEYKSSFFNKNVDLKEKRSRQIQRGNDSMKRARSVEALVRYDSKAWERDIKKDSSENLGQDTNCLIIEEIVNGKGNVKCVLPVAEPVVEVTIESKIVNARERGDPRPKKIAPLLEEKERPPPDVVKEKLRIFESTANRKSRSNCRSEVAVKVASYKTIISHEKPAIVYPKPPQSPIKKPVIKPRFITAPTNGSPPKSPVKEGGPSEQLNGSTSPQINDKLTETSTPKSKLIDFSSRPLSPLSLDLTSYRSKKLDSPVSPVATLSPHPLTSPSQLTPTVFTKPVIRIPTTNYQRPESPKTPPDVKPRRNLASLQTDSPVTNIAKKLQSLKIESPKPSIPSSTSSSMDEKSTDDDYEEDDDGSSSEVDGVMQRISKLAPVNIPKTCESTQFNFTKNSSSVTVKPSTLLPNNNHLPQQNGTGAGVLPAKIAVAPKRVGIEPLSPSKAKIVDEKVLPPVVVQQQAQVAPVTSPQLTSREIVKNSINREKSAAAAAAVVPQIDTAIEIRTNTNSPSSVSVVNKNSINSSPVTPSSSLTSTSVSVTAATAEPQLNKWGLKKKNDQNTSKVFNFTDRKDVPDYIEHAGIDFIRRKPVLPKPGSSGYVILPSHISESSTDPEDYWSMGPPSPCNVEFENSNIIIDGKSNIRNRNKTSKLNIKFDDSLTTTFEYPSETSLLLDDTDSSSSKSFNNSQTNNAQQTSNQKLIGSMSLGSAPLGSYMPVKASINRSFELGVTRNGTTNSNDVELNGSASNGTVPATATTGTAATTNGLLMLSSNDQNGIGGGGGANGDTESLQYLKPATDEQTVAWSEGTRVTDLLF